MKGIRLILLILVLNTIKVSAQSVFKNEGSTIKVCPQTAIIIEGDYYHTSDDASLAIEGTGIIDIRGSLINLSTDSITSGDTGEIIVSGDSIFSTNASRFHVLTINANEDDSLIVAGNIVITDSLFIQSGSVYSPKDTVFLVFFENINLGLQSFGDLVNESNTNRLITLNPGSVSSSDFVTTSTLSGGVDLGQLGFTLTMQGSNGQLGLSRNNNAILGPENGTLQRSYIVSYDGGVSNGTISVQYFDIEMDSLSVFESDFQLFRRQIVSSDTIWQVIEGENDTDLNTVTGTGIDDVNGLWTISYCNIPTPAIGGDLNVCVQSGGTLIANITAPEDYTFRWFRDGSELLNENNDSLEFSLGSEPVEFIVQVRDEFGCTGSDTVAVLPELIPAVDLGSDIFACPDETIMLDGGPGYATYAWLDRNGSLLGSDQTLTVTDSSQYILEITNSPGCVNSDTILVAYYALPVSNLVDSVFVCGVSTTLGTGLLGDNPDATFEWFDEDGNTLASSATFAANLNGNYVVEITNSQGCSIRDSINLRLSENIQVVLPDLGPDVQFCEGESVILDPGSSFDSYLWSTGESTSSITTELPGEYFVTAITSVGCEASDTIVVSFFPPIVHDLQPSIISCNSFTVLGENLETLNPNAEFLWQPTGEITPVITVDSEGIYEVTITSPDGCSLTVGTEVTLNDPNFVDLGPDILSECAAVDLDPGLDGMFLWNTGETSPVINVQQSGDYWVEVTTDEGCTDRDTVSVEIIQSADSAFYLVATEALVNDTLVFIGLPSSTPDSLGWDWNDGTSPLGEFDLFPQHQYVMAGEFNPVFSTFYGDCFDDYSKTVSITEILEEEEISLENGRFEAIFNQITIFPNPNKGKFKLEMELTRAAEVHWAVADISGAVLMSGVSEERLDHSISYDLSSVQDGIYILQLISENEKKSFRIRIQKSIP